MKEIRCARNWPSMYSIRMTEISSIENWNQTNVPIIWIKIRVNQAIAIDKFLKFSSDTALIINSIKFIPFSVLLQSHDEWGQMGSSKPSLSFRSTSLTIAWILKYGSQILDPGTSIESKSYSDLFHDNLESVHSRSII